MRKIVLLHKRRGGDVEAFHAAIADTARGDGPIPGLNAYVQSHTLVRGYAKGELLFDAVEEFSFPDSADAAAFKGSAAYRDIEARRRYLVDEGQSLAMLVDVYRVKDTPVPAGAVKNIEFVNRRPGMELEAFRHYWREVHGPIGSRIPSILRYEQNHLARESYEGRTPRYDGLAVTWFTSTAAMREGAQSEAYEVTRADEANFLPDGHLPIIITRETFFR